MGVKKEDERLVAIRAKAKTEGLTKEDVGMAVAILRGERWEAMRVAKIKGKARGKKKVKEEEENENAVGE